MKTLDLLGEAESEVGSVEAVLRNSELGKETAASDGLPEGWIWATVGDLSQSIEYGYTESATVEPVGPKFLRITDIQDGGVNWSTVPYCTIPPEREGKLLLQTGDIVFARTGATTGKSHLIQNPPYAVFASYLIRVRAVSQVPPKYLSLFFQSPYYWEQITDKSVGIGQPNCNGSKLASIVMPVPPLAEQKRIVAQVEAALASVDAARERLAHVPALLKKFRQSVLAAACSGRLTAEWREANPGVEPASELLARIRAERQGKEGKKPKEPAVPDTSDLGDLPEGWAIIQLGEAVSVLNQGWSPQCDNLPADSLDDWAVIKTSAVQQMAFVEHENKKLPPNLTPREHLEIKSGDLLITRAGPRVRAGVVCLVRDVRPKLILCDKVYRFRLYEELAIPSYVEIVLNSHAMVQTIDDLKTGISESGMNITQQAFAALVLSLPPVSEQSEIVRRVDALFALADAIEKRVHAATARTEEVTQAVLAKAFRGELVENEAERARREGRDFQSAGELLRQAQKDSPNLASSGKRHSKSRAALGK